LKIDAANIRSDFPFFNQKERSKNIIYFDNAATTQKPHTVIDAISRFYSSYNSNVNRGSYLVANEATESFELTRQKIKKHLNAKHLEEIIFTSGATQSINLVASSFVSTFLSKGDEILIGKLEHHANIVPWQLACEKIGAKVRPLGLSKNGLIDVSNLKKNISPNVKLIVFQHTSNVTGLTNDVKNIAKICKENNIYSFVDGAQAIAHENINVQELGCDFFCFSGHKCFGPTGTGVLYGKIKILNSMPPYMGGGEMIESVSLENSSWNSLPHKLEAGTPNIAGFIGLGSAFSYMNNIGIEKIKNIESVLANELYVELSKVKNIIFYGEKGSVPICSFNIKGIHSYDIGAILSEQGVCVRTGHLCAQPATSFFKTNSFIRASLCFYNTKEEIHNFINCLNKAIKMLS